MSKEIEEEPSNGKAKKCLKLISDKKRTAAIFESLIENLGESKVAIFTHNSPDIDAMSSIMAVEFIFRRKYNIECGKFYTGRISHPQNIAMDNLLDSGLRPVSEYDSKEFKVNILVDTVPSNAGVGDHEVNFDLVIDHHPDLPNGDFKGVVINLKAGSCAGTLCTIIRELGIAFDDDNDYDRTIATALVAGIYTDTEHMLSVDTTEYEREAFAYLSEWCSFESLRKIVFYKRPRAWINARADAYSRAYTEEEGFAIVGMGFLAEKHWDLIADQADEMVQWDACHTAFAYAVIGDNTLVGCVRSENPSITVKEVCKQLAGKKGEGGGKQGKGRYSYDFGGLSIEPDEEQCDREALWEALNTRERNRILRILKK